MKKFISLMNPKTFYYIWMSDYRFFLEQIIEEVIGKSEVYKLLETFNNNSNNLKSYIFLESDNSLIYIEFTKNKQHKNEAFEIFKYLKQTMEKKVILIIFNDNKNRNETKDNIFQIFKNNMNSENIKLLLSSNFKEQRKNNIKNIIDYIYDLDDNFIEEYLREETFLI